MDTLSTTNNFGYNARSELASALMGTNTYGYVYDPIGNRLTATNNTEVLHYGANELNQYTNITDGVTLTPLFDTDGNLTNDSVRAYTWDAENRLLTVEPLSPTNGEQRVACAYDYMSRRVSKIAETWNGSTWGNTATNTFVYDGWNLLEETRASTSTIINSYTWGLDLSQSLQGAGGIGGLLMANLDGTSVFYYHDGNGNVTELTDGTGAIVAHYEYSPFGETTAKTGVFADANPFRFSAKYTDGETGLLYYGYRYYQSSMGRWLSKDPIEEEGDISLYGFLRQNAVCAIDGLGLRVLVIGHAWAMYSPWHHSSLLIIPDNQNTFAGHPDFKLEELKDIGCSLYLTIGAEKKSGKLVSSLNRPTDHPDKNTKYGDVGSLLSDTDLIIALLQADATYADGLPYDPFPGPGYNSNSFTYGIVLAVGADVAKPSANFPGWDFPVPLNFFH